jgi:acyl-CoA synthetase (AMP-forming)/AMP-acid ligase II
VGDLQLAVIGISDEAIPAWSEDLRVPDGTIGEIAVKGPIVTQAYFNRPEATALAKIPDPAGGFWHRMGDLGHRDAQGRIWFCGRKSHRVRTREGTLFTIQVEAVFNTHPAVRRPALVGVGRPGEQIPVLCVELNADARDTDRQKLAEELRAIGRSFDHTRGIRPILFHPSFPVDIRHNAKIFREKLAVWAAARLPR